MYSLQSWPFNQLVPPLPVVAYFLSQLYTLKPLAELGGPIKASCSMKMQRWCSHPMHTMQCSFMCVQGTPFFSSPYLKASLVKGVCIVCSAVSNTQCCRVFIWALQAIPKVGFFVPVQSKVGLLVKFVNSQSVLWAESLCSQGPLSKKLLVP